MWARWSKIQVVSNEVMNSSEVHSVEPPRLGAQVFDSHTVQGFLKENFVDQLALRLNSVLYCLIYE